MNTNFAKLCALAILGGAVKALFQPVRPVTNNYYEEPKHDKSPGTEIEIGSSN